MRLGAEHGDRRGPTRGATAVRRPAARTPAGRPARLVIMAPNTRVDPVDDRLDGAEVGGQRRPVSPSRSLGCR